MTEDEEFEFRFRYEQEQKAKSKSKQLPAVTGLKEGFVGPGNLVDRAISSMAALAVQGMNERPKALGGAGGKMSPDEVFAGMEERVKQRNKWANPYGEEVPLIPSVMGKIPSLPAQVLTYPLSAFNTGQKMIANGETLNKARAGTAIDTVGNMAAAALPMSIGSNVLVKAGSGAAANVAQEAATGNAIAAIADKEQTKKDFTPTAKSLAEAGILGLGFGALGPSTPLKNPFKKKTGAVESDIKKGLDEYQAAKKAEEVTPEIRREDMSNESQQLPLFDQPEEGRMANPYEAKLGDWRVDENGIPIKADLSMEVQNLQNPLQRNLWGDELERTRNPIGQSADLEAGIRQLDDEGQGSGLNLTDAIDAIPDTPFKGDQRDIAMQQLQGAIEPSGQLQAAMVESRRRGGNQSGAIDFEEIGRALGNFRTRFGTPEDSLDTPISPEMIAAKQQQRTKAEKATSIVGEKLPEYFDPQTFEEVVTLARDAKDIKSNPYSRGVAPGNNFMATYHNNPLLKYMRKVIGDARGAASAFSREYVTGENGVSPAIVKLNSKEKVQVAELLTELDKRQIDWNPEMSAKLGLSDSISNYMNAHQKAMDAQWEWHLKNTGEQGLNIARKRRGYSPSVFEGQYNALVMQDGKPVGVIAVDSPGEFMKAKEYYSKKYPTAKFSANTWQQARRSFSGGASSAFKYRDLGAMIDLLAKADGDFAKVQMKVDQEILRASTDLFNFNVHNLAKSNVEGNLGNKGWMSPEKNAQQRLDSVVKFLEEAAEHHSLQKPMEELRLLMADDSTKNLTNTKEYMDDYMKNISGSYLNNAGKVINAAFDGLHKGLVESVAAHIPGVRNYVGPGNTLKVSNFIKNKMSQMYMGWFNWTFTASQFMQPVQTGAPMLEMVAGRLGLPVADAAKSLSVGGGDFVKVQLHRMGLIDNLDPRIADAVDWAEKRGLLDFTELERAYEGNKTRVGRALDKAAEVNMKIGENGTRPPMFLAFVDMVSKVEPNKTRAYEIAENLTNQAMADYHKYERPLMYTGMGVLSPHVGGLTTFKHNYTGTQVLLGKEALKPGLRSKAPLAMSAMTMLMLGGITGTMFYNEFNTIYEYLREKYSGEKRSIAQDMLQAMPQYAKTGIISSILDLNMQGKFSSADMIPDTFAKAAFPHLSGAYDIAAAGYDAARNPNENTLGNFAVAATPSGMKQASKYAFKSDEEGNLINKYGQVESPRTEEEWKRSIISGLVPLGEANKSQALYQNRKNEKARMERMTKLSQDFKAAVLAGEDPDKIAEILNAYEEVGGLGQSLVSQIPKIHQEAQKNAQERAEGVPSSRAAIRRYEAYQN